jgi:hypothetical protein
MRRISRPLVLVILAGLALLSGCQPATPPPATRAAASVDDCADRLHELCGPLLLFYMAHHRLPNDLAEFKAANPTGLPELVCPKTHLPYVWRPDGPAVAGQHNEVLLADVTPAHDGKRWAIVNTSVNAAGPLTLRVSLLPTARPAAAAGPR